MGATILGLLASVALGALAESSALSLTSAVALVWLALAPLVRSRGAAQSASLVAACASPFLGFAVASDHAAGAAWGPLALRAVFAAAGCAALAASGASACERRRGASWLAACFALVAAAPVASLALAMGGDGAQWAPVAALESLSPLAWAARALPLSSADFEAATFSSAPLRRALAPAVALVVLAWLSRRAPAHETSGERA
jgi:hypothetical protein